MRFGATLTSFSASADKFLVELSAWLSDKTLAPNSLLSPLRGFRGSAPFSDGTTLGGSLLLLLLLLLSSSLLLGNSLESTAAEDWVSSSFDSALLVVLESLPSALSEVSADKAAALPACVRLCSSMAFV